MRKSGGVSCRKPKKMAAVPGEKERLALVRARLAAEEREALEAIKEDLCQWLSKPGVLALDIAPASFLPVLDSGVPTSTLAGLVQEGARRCNTSGKMLSVTVPMTPLACKSIKAPRGTAMYQACARDNAAQFIEWCRSLGVEEAVIFESVGLVEHRDERRVILCLLDVARFAEKVGITPPQLVALEKEIDQLESESESCVDEATSNEHQLSQPEIEKEHFSDQQSDKGVPVVGDDTLSDRRTGSSEETEPREEEWVSEERCSDSDKKMSEGAEEEKTESEEEPPTKRLKRVSDNLTKETGSCTLSPNQPPPQQPPLHTHSHGKQLIHRRSKQWDKRKPVQSKQSPAGKKETVDEKVKTDTAGNVLVYEFFTFLTLHSSR